MTSTTPTTPATSARISEPDNTNAQYLTFTCANEEYGVEILRVQEIRGWFPVTRLPQAPHDVEPRPVDAATVVIVLRVRLS
jgi:purine-binding chemotaxis protein CheW